MDRPSDLSRMAALRADEPQPRFLVCSYEKKGEVLQEVGLDEAPSEEATILLGQILSETNATVVVLRQVEDGFGVVRSAVLSTFERG